LKKINFWNVTQEIHTLVERKGYCLLYTNKLATQYPLPKTNLDKVSVGETFPPASELNSNPRKYIKIFSITYT